LYDPMSGTWSVAGLMGAPRASHSATLLPNGKVLVAGGQDSTQTIGTAELYDPGTGSWTLSGSPVVPRVHHSATLLPNGKVLFAGGDSGIDSTITAERYDPANGQWIATRSMTEARGDHTRSLPRNRAPISHRDAVSKRQGARHGRNRNRWYPDYQVGAV